MKRYSFEKLEAWRVARQLRTRVYKLSEGFPVSERYNIPSQIRRAAVSVINNLAEGSGRATAKDQAHYSVMAYGSTLEVFNLLFIASDEGYIEESVIEEFRPQVNQLTSLINGLRKSQLQRARSNGQLLQEPDELYGLPE